MSLALYLTAQVLLSKGDEVIVGDPGYYGANEIFQQAGARLNLVAVDRAGLDVDEVESICKNKKVRLLYVIPHHLEQSQSRCIISEGIIRVNFKQKTKKLTSLSILPLLSTSCRR